MRYYLQLINKIVIITFTIHFITLRKTICTKIHKERNLGFITESNNPIA